MTRLTGTNEDGRTLLAGYEPESRDKVEVADELIDRAIEMGFLSEGGQVSISLDCPDEVLFEEYGVELREGITAYFDGRIVIDVTITDHRSSAPEGTQVSDEPPEQQTPDTQQEPDRPVSSESGYTPYEPPAEAAEQPQTPAGSQTPSPVSYTHLDVYKRQSQGH